MFVLEYVVGLACVLVSQLILAGAFVGVGLLIRRAFAGAPLRPDDMFTAFWMGFSSVTVALILWHFVRQIDVMALTTVLLAGATGLVIARESVRHALRGIAGDNGRVWLIAWIVVALYVANQGLGNLTYSDSALYHLQAVVWNKTYAVVPGLANLFGPLGFNNASLLYGALLDVGPWNGLGHRLANGLLVQVLAARIIVALARISSAGRQADSREMFLVALIPGVVSLTLLGRLSSYATATTTAIVVMVIAEHLYTFLTATDKDPREQAYAVFCITTLSAVAVTLKLSAVVFAAPVTLVAVAVWLLRRSRSDGLLRRTMVCTLGAAALFGAAWMTRSVVLSGYPLFPSTIAGAPVDWRVPAEHADAEYALAAHSAFASTMLYEVVAGRDRWGWLPRWFRISLRDPFDFIVPALIAAIAALALLLRRGRAAHRARAPSAGMMLVPTVIAIAAWFLLAPEGRYAVGFFWALAALAVAQWWRSRDADVSAPVRRTLIAGATAAAVITLVVVPALHVPFEAPGAAAKTLIKSMFRMWDSRDWYRQIEQPQLSPFRTASGLVVSVPRDRCWSAPVPCTPNPAATLELRDSTNIRHGFRVRGAWTMQDWPFKSRPDFLRAWRESRAEH